MKIRKMYFLIGCCLALLVLRNHMVLANASPLKSFSFSTAGMSRYEFREFTVQKEEQGLSLKIDVWVEKDGEGQQVTIDKIVDEPQLFTGLENLIVQLNLEEWNGFNKTNHHVLDGDGFGFLAVYEDGNAIRARGTVSHPKNYQQVRTAIFDFFKPYVEKYNEQHTGSEYL